MREWRSALPPEHRLKAAEAVAERLVELLDDVELVASFAAHADELDLAAFHRRWLADGKRLGFPRVTNPGEMEFHEVETLDALTPGAFGILEPPPHAAVSPSAFHAILVPGLAFDAAGNRLGFGGGFYDRALASAPEVLTIGVAYDAQLVTALPIERWDVPVRLLVTELRAVRTDA